MYQIELIFVIPFVYENLLVFSFINPQSFYVPDIIIEIIFTLEPVHYKSKVKIEDILPPLL